MRIVAAIACFIVAFYAAGNAEADPVPIFSASAAWLWWVFAVWWGLIGACVLFRGTE